MFPFFLNFSLYGLHYIKLFNEVTRTEQLRLGEGAHAMDIEKSRGCGGDSMSLQVAKQYCIYIVELWKPKQNK
jgi:hypothetical protein